MMNDFTLPLWFALPLGSCCVQSPQMSLALQGKWGFTYEGDVSKIWLSIGWLFVHPNLNFTTRLNQGL
jgi:hypothetical protein